MRGWIPRRHERVFGGWPRLLGNPAELQSREHRARDGGRPSLLPRSLARGAHGGLRSGGGERSRVARPVTGGRPEGRGDTWRPAVQGQPVRRPCQRRVACGVTSGSDGEPQPATGTGFVLTGSGWDSVAAAYRAICIFAYSRIHDMSKLPILPVASISGTEIHECHQNYFQTSMRGLISKTFRPKKYLA